MITETNKFKVITNNPWIHIGGISHRDYLVREILPTNKYPEDYPGIFAPIYKLEDGTEVCLGDLIWRSKNYEVKSTTFSEVHIRQNTPVFGTRETCEKWLKKNADNIKTELLKQNADSSFQTLKALVGKLDNLEDLSYVTLANIRDGIKACIQNIENT